MADETEKNPTETREGLLLVARLAMKNRDYRSMLDYMKKLVEIVMPTEDLSEEERDCFCSACKLLVDFHLKSWRHLYAVANDNDGSCSRRESAREYQEIIADEIKKTCKEIFEFINRSVLFSGEGEAAKAMTTESRVFYMTMKGDFLSYAAVVTKGPGRVDAEEAAIAAYNGAMVEASKLPELNLTRLRLALNFGVLQAEICEAFSLGCNVVKWALNMANRALARSYDEISYDVIELLEELQSKYDSWMAEIVALKYPFHKIREGEAEEMNKICRRLSGIEIPFKWFLG